MDLEQEALNHYGNDPEIRIGEDYWTVYSLFVKDVMCDGRLMPPLIV